MKRIFAAVLLVFCMTAAASVWAQTIADPAIVRASQTVLRALGYDTGVADGVAGPRTEAAIQQYQFDEALPVTGILDERTASALLSPLLPDAIQRADTSQTRMLLQAGVDPDYHEAGGVVPLLAAILARENAIVTLLLDAGADPDVIGTDGVPVLVTATRNSDLDLVNALLAKGANPNVADTAGIAPLLMAAAGGANAMLEALLAAGADVEAKTAEGATPLQLAVANGDTEAVAAIVAAGADVDALGAAGQTPLITAAANTNTDIVGLLLDAGALPDLKDPNGLSALRGPRIAMMATPYSGSSKPVRPSTARTIAA